jgi:hypothetical protein
MEQLLMSMLIVPTTFAALGVVEQVQKRRGSVIQAEKLGYESAFLAHSCSVIGESNPRDSLLLDAKYH